MDGTCENCGNQTEVDDSGKCTNCSAGIGDHDAHTDGNESGGHEGGNTPPA